MTTYNVDERQAPHPNTPEGSVLWWQDIARSEHLKLCAAERRVTFWRTAAWTFAILLIGGLFV